jgi:hypothetical protein
VRTVRFACSRHLRVVGCVLLLLALAGCGSRGLVRSELLGRSQDGPKRLLVVPADFVITEVTFGKTEERVVSAEKKASAVLAQHIRELGRQQHSYELAELDQFSEDERDVILQHRALFATMVSQMLLVKEDAVDVWASKLKYFDYTLGPGMADLARAHGVDTAIFIVGKDKVRSTSRKILDSITAVLPLGESLSSQPAAVVAGVVDMATGNVLMFDSEMASRKALTNEDDVKSMGESVLTDFRKALKPRDGAK